ncbi:formimidoylglutamate deiminase [Hymenobacter properus]|uniref:Formimidoylglutamate deiminase n=1 Tax=Hymenobacter properus TaxID=2791026 RepID=A0A931BEX9_9BACT|nr:formimidoylglutamate deiminase [Hymenobacter properus]MBF9140077.1 formimidoylglutamate deiminase [Hymenobacter properus]MBR7718884.1 formimidoylglutamate deiminase [Microvirga sp. SRT04]
MTYYQFSSLLLQDGWLSPAYVGVNAQGIIEYLSQEPPVGFEISIEKVEGAALPGFQNAHSHAFQYGMAGHAEQHVPGTRDDFWSWREAMYACAETFSPEQNEQVATTLYRHLLRNGYTTVVEFHYLHHDPTGRPYANLAEMGERLVAAARTAGIKITLVPVFYQKGDFGREPAPRQRRFISPTLDDYLKLLDASRPAVAAYERANLGFGVHSLRAVEAADVLATHAQGPKDLPFHLHAAEQTLEVERSLAHLGARPVEWLLDNLPLNERFHLVHCTHLTTDETTHLAQSGANVVLCPGTEGNLGDGIFSLVDYAEAGGHWSIGTDSHISLNPLEDLRWLDYGQRLIHRRRNIFADGASVLVDKTFFAGHRAAGRTPVNYFALGQPLDAVVYDLKQPLLAQAGPAHLLPALVYTTDPTAILGTLVDGQWAYRAGEEASVR